MMSFENSFWGEKNNGFGVLYHNMKYGLESSKEFEEFLRESCKVEESYVKQQANLAKSAGGNCSGRGTFAPFWLVMKTLVEKLANIHQQLMLSWQELLREVHKYNNDQQRKHREVKEQEAGTQEAVQTIQQTISSLNRAKETYHTRCLELERFKRERVAQKDIERAESRTKRACDEYMSLIEKYTNNRNEFEVSMTESCKRFQELEEKHLQQMKDFVDAYAKSWENQHAMLGQIYSEFKCSTESLTIESLIESFIKSKGTGAEKPGTIEFVSPDLSTLTSLSTLPDSERREQGLSDKAKRESGQSDNISQGSASDTNVPAPKTSTISIDRTLALRGLLNRHRKDKKSKKPQNKEKDETDTPDKGVQVDDEGYIIRPENPINNRNQDSSDSSSDSDSDVDERRIKKLAVEIKPLPPPNHAASDNVDDIRNVALNIRLSPVVNRRTPVNENCMKHSNSLGGMIPPAKPSQDLIDLDLFDPVNTTPISVSGSVSAINGDKLSTSSATTPTARDSVDNISSSSLDDSISSLTQRHKVSTPTNSSLPPLLAGPIAPSRPSRTNFPNTATARPAGRQTPDVFRMERADSVSQLNSTSFNSSSSFGTSRGPSPLTIGFSENIPLAIAFSETVHAVIHSSDASKSQVKVTGDMVVSFPAGIVRGLTENSNPSTLSFRIKNTANISQIFANKQLIVEDETKSTTSSRVYTFDMTSLLDHLRRQAEQNKTAAYFNIDIVKYQVKTYGIQSLPLHLVSSWSVNTQQINFQLDYKYNGAALSQPCPLNNVGLIVPVDASVSQLQSQPAGSWSSESRRAMWKLGDVMDTSENGGKGSVVATFELSSQSSESVVATPSVAAVQFSIDGATLSGIDLELAGPGYRLSLLKRRIVSGKYVSGVD